MGTYKVQRMVFAVPLSLIPRHIHKDITGPQPHHHRHVCMESL